MEFARYLIEFERVLNSVPGEAPYDKAEYREYTKLNWSRMNRWLKKGELTASLQKVITQIDRPQRWIIITEPWCGDAAHTVPFIQLAAQLNPLIAIDYELRDRPPFRINEYLTNGGKSIPKLVIRDEHGTDLATWGPRPAACQKLYEELKAESADFDTLKVALQKWYNEDRGLSLQAELAALLEGAAGNPLTSSTQSPAAAHQGNPRL